MDFSKRVILSEEYNQTIKHRDYIRDQILMSLTWKQFQKSEQDFTVDALKKITKNKKILDMSNKYTELIKRSRTLRKELDKYDMPHECIKPYKYGF